MPIWGTKSWRILTLIVSIGILLIGSWLTITAYYSNSPIWWYNISFIVFGFTLLGLFFLVREGAKALNNIQTYGFNPRRSASDMNSETDDRVIDLQDQIEMQSKPPEEDDDY